MLLARFAVLPVRLCVGLAHGVLVVDLLRATARRSAFCWLPAPMLVGPKSAPHSEQLTFCADPRNSVLLLGLLLSWVVSLTGGSQQSLAGCLRGLVQFQLRVFPASSLTSMQEEEAPVGGWQGCGIKGFSPTRMILLGFVPLFSSWAQFVSSSWGSHFLPITAGSIWTTARLPVSSPPARLGWRRWMARIQHPHFGLEHLGWICELG